MRPIKPPDLEDRDHLNKIAKDELKLEILTNPTLVEIAKYFYRKGNPEVIDYIDSHVSKLITRLGLTPSALIKKVDAQLDHVESNNYFESEFDPNDTELHNEIYRKAMEELNNDGV